MPCLATPGVWLGSCKCLVSPLDINPWKWSARWADFFPKDARYADSSYLAWDIRNFYVYDARKAVSQTAYIHYFKPLVEFNAESVDQPFKFFQNGADLDVEFEGVSGLKIGAPGGKPIKPNSRLHAPWRVRVQMDVNPQLGPDGNAEAFGFLQMAVNGDSDINGNHFRSGLGLRTAKSGKEAGWLSFSTEVAAGGPVKFTALTLDEDGALLDTLFSNLIKHLGQRDGVLVDKWLYGAAADAANPNDYSKDPEHRSALIRLAVAWDWR